MKTKMTLSAQAQKMLKERIKEQIGFKAEKIVFNLQEEILKRTPVQTGRTLASWKVTSGAPSNYDAGDDHWGMSLVYAPLTHPQTNGLPVGAEPGRASAERIAKQGREDIGIRRDPYRKFFVSNAAALAPRLGNGTGITNPEAAGSRAFYMNIGSVPGYDIYRAEYGGFENRGLGMFELAIARFLANYGR